LKDILRRTSKEFNLKIKNFELLTYYICKLHYFYVLCNMSFKEHLPEDGQNKWPKHVVG